MALSECGVTLRAATNEDADAIRRLVFGVLAEYGLQPDPCATDADLDDIAGQYVLRGGLFDVLVDETGAIIGSVGLFPIKNRECELRKMYLAPQYRGKGLGTRLLDHAIESARALGFSRVTLETASVLREAIALYERSGFRQYTAKHLACRCDQAYYLDLDGGCSS